MEWLLQPVSQVYAVKEPYAKEIPLRPVEARGQYYDFIGKFAEFQTSSAGAESSSAPARPL